MKRILFISSFHPGGQGQIGAGEAICGDSLTRFLDEGYVVDAYVISPEQQRANSDIAARCNKYVVSPVSRKKTILSILKNSMKGALVAPWFFTRVQHDVVIDIRRMINENNYDFIWLDFPSSLGFAALIEHPDIRYCAHDVVAQRIERSVVKKWISGSVRRIEASLFKKLSHISVLSDKDLGLIKDMGFCGSTSIIELGSQKVGIVDDAVSVETIVQEFRGKTNLVFFGNMRRSENHWSIMWFILFVFLRLYGKNHRLHLWVLGICPRISLRLISKLIPNVHVVGAVDDPSLAFKTAELCIAPLLFGAGVKIKVIQMLDAGATVMATPVGAEGVDSNKRLIIVESKYFFNALFRYWN